MSRSRIALVIAAAAAVVVAGASASRLCISGPNSDAGHQPAPMAVESSAPTADADHHDHARARNPPTR